MHGPTHHGQLVALEHLGQLLDDVVIHVVVFAPGGLGCVDVEASAAPKVVALILAFDLCPARARVWVQDGNLLLGCLLVKGALLCAIVFGACQPGEVVEDGDAGGLLSQRRRGQKEVEVGRQVAQHLGLERVLAQLAAVALVDGLELEVVWHAGQVWWARVWVGAGRVYALSSTRAGPPPRCR